MNYENSPQQIQLFTQMSELVLTAERMLREKPYLLCRVFIIHLLKFAQACIHAF